MGLTREQFEQLTNRSPDIIVGTDRKGRVIYFNDGAHDSLGYESEEVLGEFVGLFYPSVEEARRVSEAMRSTGRGPSLPEVWSDDSISTSPLARRERFDCTSSNQLQRSMVVVMPRLRLSLP